MIPSLFRGDWLEPGQSDYESARPAFNRRVDARPAVIARCLGVSDVVAAVRYAREHRLDIEVRSAGLSLAAQAASGGMLIDLGLMRAVHVFPERRVARIQGGVRGGDLQLEAGVHGLGAATGALSGAGVGLMLGGGIGLISPRAGFAVENILALELVTATGEVVTASPEENPDLFWAARGAAGNFGVVTALDVRLHEVPPLVQVGMLTWSLEHIDRGIEVLRASWGWDDALGLISYISNLSLDGRGGLDMMACHSGPPAEASADFARLLEVGVPDEHVVGSIRFADQHFANDALFPPMRGATNQQPVEELSDTLVEALVAHIREPGGDGGRLVELLPLRGAMSRAPALPSAFRETAQAPAYSLIAGAWWESPAEDQMHEQWVQEVVGTIERIGPVADRRDPSCVGAVLDPESVARVYGDRFDRLREAKRRWDPEHVFAGSQTIAPA